MSMKRIAGMSAVATALALSALAPAGAAGATEFGDNCSADETELGQFTLVTVKAPPGIQLAAPVSGVITQVRIRIATPLPLVIPEQVKVMRPLGGDNYLVTDQATVDMAGGGTGIETRMQVQAGERLGIVGLPFEFSGMSYPGVEFYCEAGPDSALGATAGNLGVGGSAAFPAGLEARVPLSAVIEPDADHDGYGDETQDKCPQSAALQVPCPPVILDSFVLPNKSKAVVLVSTSVATKVSVSGSAKLPKPPKSAGTSARAKLKKVSKEVVPGQLKRFTLNFPTTLKTAVESLTPGNSITVKLQASATDLIGKKVTDKSQLKIRAK